MPISDFTGPGGMGSAGGDGLSSAGTYGSDHGAPVDLGQSLGPAPSVSPWGVKPYTPASAPTPAQSSPDILGWLKASSIFGLPRWGVLGAAAALGIWLARR